MRKHVELLIVSIFLSLPIWSAHNSADDVTRREALQASSLNTVIPHITHGSYWRSSLIIMNVSAQPSSFRIQFFKPNGQDAKFKAEGLGDIHEAFGVLQPGGSTTIRSIQDSSPTETLYWAEIIEGSGQIQVTSVFTLDYPGSQPVEFTVPNVDDHAGRIYFLFDNTHGYGTAIALANASHNRDELYTLEARNEAGAVIFSGDIALPARNNMTAVLRNLFPQLVDEKGTILLKLRQTHRPWSIVLLLCFVLMQRGH